jgi:membrane-associated phospholipid phosphatase
MSLPLRLLVLLAALAVWLAQYFAINRIASPRCPRIRSITALDRALPFVPAFAGIYLSACFFDLLPFVLIASPDLFWRTLTGYALITLVSSGIHWAFPSQVDRPSGPRPTSLSLACLIAFQATCRPHGNFPSTHVAFAMLSASTALVLGGPVVGGLCVLWAGLIALSTLLTRQHYCLDVAAGVGVGVCAAALVNWTA